MKDEPDGCHICIWAREFDRRRTFTDQESLDTSSPKDYTGPMSDDNPFAHYGSPEDTAFRARYGLPPYTVVTTREWVAKYRAHKACELIHALWNIFLTSPHRPTTLIP